MESEEGVVILQCKPRTQRVSLESVTCALDVGGFLPGVRGGRAAARGLEGRESSPGKRLQFRIAELLC